MNDQSHDTTLSAHGRARRDEMLADLRRRVRARGRRRRAALGVSTTLPLLALALLIAWPARQPSPAPAPDFPDSPITQSPPSAPTLTHVTFAMVQTRPDLRAQSLSDAELLDLLREAGHADAGLARLPGRVLLTGDSLARRTDPAPDPDTTPPGPGA